MRSYIPFGPFLIGGAVLALLVDGRMLVVVR
jgi:prepilin signal peptidase PulO-like enzyme (type II secretory pathway)